MSWTTTTDLSSRETMIEIRYHCTAEIWNELSRLVEDVPSETRLCLNLQHDEAPHHFRHVVRTYRDPRLRDRWIGRGGPLHSIGHPDHQTSTLFGGT
jgi:hypothetical protein